MWHKFEMSRNKALWYDKGICIYDKEGSTLTTWIDVQQQQRLYDNIGFQDYDKKNHMTNDTSDKIKSTMTIKQVTIPILIW